MPISTSVLSSFSTHVRSTPCRLCIAIMRQWLERYTEDLINSRHTNMKARPIRLILA